MPYKSIDDLPPAVKKNLPEGAQEIYKNAYNKADKEHPDWSAADKAKYAWGAVKKAYTNEDGKWVKKMEGFTNDEFTFTMPEDDAGWARLFFHIPPEAWDEMDASVQADYISQIPVRYSISGTDGVI
jgi:cation transport regulator